MCAEAKALLQGLLGCVNKGTVEIDIEVDSMVLVQILQNNTHVPWTIAYEIRAITQILQQMRYTLRHIFRESNMVADFLANLGCKMGKHFIVEHDRMPKRLRGIVRMDRCGLPNVRWIKL